MLDRKTGSGEWGVGSGKKPPGPHSPFPIPRFLSFCLTLFCLTFSRFTDDFARPALGHSQQGQEKSAIVRLGERLFNDEGFSTPDGDLPASCRNCHLFDQDPQGLRAYADFFNRSWVSSRAKDRRRLGLRNSPTIFDVAEMPRLHQDGEIGSLEELVRGTISGRPMGWLPGEEAQAFERARSIVLNDSGAESYRNQFKAAFNVDVEKLGRDETVELIAK